MKWYYSKKGNVGQRGQADMGTLRAMAHDGRLSPNDMVCSEADSRWVLASEVDGLFPTDRPRRAGSQQSAPADDRQAPERRPAPARERHISAGRLRELVFALFCIAVFGIWQMRPHESVTKEPFVPPPLEAAGDSSAGPAPAAATGEKAVSAAKPATGSAEPSEPQAASDANPGETEEEKAWYGLCNRFEGYMKKGDVAAATRILERMINDYGSNDVTAEYLQRISTLKKAIQELDALKVLLLSGTISNEQAARLAELSLRYDRPGHLHDVMIDTLADTVNPSAARCVGVLRTAILVRDAEMARKAAVEYAVRMNPATDDLSCIEVSRLCATNGLADSAGLMMDKLVEGNPKSGPAWFEMAAMQAKAGLADEAIASLKQAVKLDGKPAKLAAQGDSRFASIRDTRAFKKCVR